jgi:hypothetical protein
MPRKIHFCPIKVGLVHLVQVQTICRNQKTHSRVKVVNTDLTLGTPLT